VAIIQPLLGTMRGRVGGLVFSHNKGGDYVRRGTTPTNPNTDRQQQTRTWLGSFSSMWTSALTQDQRDAWDLYASTNPVKNSLGQDILISGLAWYVRCCARLGDAGLGVPTLPPVLGAPAGLGALSVEITGATTATVTFDPVCSATECLQLWASTPVSLGSTPNLAQCRLMGYSGLAQGAVWPATLAHGFQVGERGVFYAALLGEEGLIGPYRQAMDTANYGA